LLTIETTTCYTGNCYKIFYPRILYHGARKKTTVFVLFFVHLFLHKPLPCGKKQNCRGVDEPMQRIAPEREQEYD